MKLPDGEYTLRLEDANNPSIKAEGKVVIDTVAPKIEDAYIHSIDTKLSEAGEAEFTYSVNASAVDQVASGVSSDIDVASLDVTFPDAPFTNMGKSLKTEEGEYQAKYNLPSTSGSSPSKLRYTASIKDQAGNKSVGFNKNFSATIEREIQISYEPSVGVAPAGIRAMSANKVGAIQPLKQGEVFYSRSGNIARIECYDTWTSSDPKFKGGTATYLVTKVSNLIPGEIPAKVSYLDKFRSNVQNKHVFYWNGKQDNKGDYATTGRYIVELEQPWNWLKVKDPKFEFKVAGIPFVTRDNWKTLPAATFFDETNKNRPVHKLQQVSHVLARHIVDRDTKREDLFGYYEKRFLIDAIPGYNYNEKDEADSGYKATLRLISTDPAASIFNDVCQLTTAAWNYGIVIDSSNNAVRDVGITYGNGQILLVRAVSYNGGKTFHTAYPDYRGKLTYESKIK